MRIMMKNSVAKVGGKDVPPGEPFDIEDGEGKGLIERGLAIAVKAGAKPGEKPVAEEEPPVIPPPKEVLERTHEGLEEIRVAEQLPNKRSQK